TCTAETFDLLEGENPFAGGRPQPAVVVPREQVTECDQPFLRSLDGRIRCRQPQRRRLRKRHVPGLEPTKGDGSVERNAGNGAPDRLAVDEQTHARDMWVRRERLHEL